MAYTYLLRIQAACYQASCCYSSFALNASLGRKKCQIFPNCIVIPSRKKNDVFIPTFVSLSKWFCVIWVADVMITSYFFFFFLFSILQIQNKFHRENEPYFERPVNGALETYTLLVLQCISSM